MIRSIFRSAILTGLAVAPAYGQVQATGHGVTLDFVDADLRAVVQALTPFLDRPVLFGQVGGARVSLQTPRPVPREEVVALLRSALGSSNYELAEDGPTYVVRARTPPPPAQMTMPSTRSRPAGGVELFVIRLRHARTADVAATVNALYGRASALGESDAVRPSSLASELRENRAGAYGVQEPGSPRPVQRSGRFEGDVTIVPDPRTNSLLVRASRGDFELIQAAVAQVDIRPLQVIIQVTIAEVRRNTDFSYALSAAVGAQAIPGTGNTTIGGTTVGVPARSDLEIRARGIGGVDLDVTLRAGVERGAVSILSRPVVFAANNERAEILVGDQVPFVQLQRTTDGGSVDQVVQYKDVGTRLSVLPTISGDGYVQLQVLQEVNNAAGGTVAAPIISTRTLETSLLVRDGQTAVLGGLAQALRDRTSSGVPFLSDIPILGGIFGSKRRRRTDTELFVFLTPRVVRDDAQMDSTVEDVRRNGGDAGRLGRKPPILLPRGKRPVTADRPDAGNPEAPSPPASPPQS